MVRNDSVETMKTQRLAHRGHVSVENRNPDFDGLRMTFNGCDETPSLEQIESRRKVRIVSILTFLTRMLSLS